MLRLSDASGLVRLGTAGRSFLMDPCRCLNPALFLDEERTTAVVGGFLSLWRSVAASLTKMEMLLLQVLYFSSRISRSSLVLPSHRYRSTDVFSFYNASVRLKTYAVPYSRGNTRVEPFPACVVPVRAGTRPESSKRKEEGVSSYVRKFQAFNLESQSLFRE